MAIKVSAKNVLDIDFTTNVVDANKKTALNVSDLGDCLFEINDKTLTITNGDNVVTVNNAQKLKYIKSTNTIDYKDIITEGFFNNIAPITINTSKLNIKGATNYNNTVDLSGVSGLTKTVKKQKVLKTSEDKGFTVSGLKGNDTITGSKYSDTL